MSLRLVALSLFVFLGYDASSKLVVRLQGQRSVAGHRKGAGSLAIVDPAAGRLVASVPEHGVTGHEVAASPEGRLAYVPIYGDS